jgi:aspartate carbamoyltransferase regulatory subunit
MTGEQQKQNVLLIPKIENGVVIDHIIAGNGVKILAAALRHAELSGVVITLGMNCESRKYGSKDLIKFQIRELPLRFLQHLALISPGVTVKRIKNFVVEKKIVIKTPKTIDNFLKCPNPGCVTNFESGIKTCFKLREKDPLVYACHYCERIFSRSELDL